MPEANLIIGTRGSALALTQAEWVRAGLKKAHPRLRIEIKIIRTTGDRKTGISLAKSGTVGLFTREIQQALLRRQADLAVHSLKDLPVKQVAGLKLAAILAREDPRDALVYRPDTDPLKPLRLFTSSPRRISQARRIWPEAKILPIRGNVETRLQKMNDGKPGDALLLAAAGMLRLGFLKHGKEDGVMDFEGSLHFRILSVQEMIPAPGQGAIAVEIREDDGEAEAWLRSLNHAGTAAAVTAERMFLQALGGGCSEPVGAHAVAEPSGDLRLVAWVELEEGRGWREEMLGSRQKAGELGVQLGDAFKNRDQASA